MYANETRSQGPSKGPRSRSFPTPIPALESLDLLINVQQMTNLTKQGTTAKVFRMEGKQRKLAKENASDDNSVRSFAER